MRLFKYLPVDRLDVIDGLKIRFTQLGSLNDVQEMIHGFDVEKVVEASLDKSMIELSNWWNEFSEEEKSLNHAEYDDGVRNLQSLTGALIAEYKTSIELSKMFDKVLGILSLSKTNDSLLMWSHYADSGCGYVIEFDSNHDFFHKKDLKGCRTEPIEVTYEECQPLYDISQRYNSSQMLGVKSKEWEYEKEVRLTLNLIGLKPQVNPSNRPLLDAFGNKIYLIDIPKEAITAIYLGPRISSVNRNRIMESIASNGIRCKVYEADITGKQFTALQL
ncbi:DUF2971 domain-containing protein [Vibrio maritimus]|uniref:DUF2971 domain-containing protein n=1 Tax=Vibrio maritimus TaxID=990268 RepID=UPI004067ABC5